MTNQTTDLSLEVQAMSEIERALSGLEEDARARVLRWAVDRFKRRSEYDPTPDFVGSVGGSKELPEFFSEAQPATEADRALVVGYWHQFAMGDSELDAQTINSDLKNLGHQVSNITRSLDTLIAQKPQLIIQTKKTGTAKQARKRYKLTSEGKRAVEAMLERAAEKA